MARGSDVIASVLIPAHQEEAVIGRCLSRLLDDASPGEFEVLVVANGCTDATADVARSFEPLVRVIETPVGSKSAALNLGDAQLHHFPRLYVDADVVLTSEGARALATIASEEAPVLATGRRLLQMGDCTLATRWYFRTWEALQSARRETIGAGVYALNRAGRQRFASFPDSIGDDTFVHSLFSSNERLVVDHLVKVWPAARLSEVVAVRSRVALGNMMAPRGPGTRDRPSTLSQIRHLVAHHPSALLGLPFYVAVTVLVRVRARSRLRNGDRVWTRAERRITE